MSIVYNLISFVMFVIQCMLQFECYEFLLTPCEEKASRLHRTLIFAVCSIIAMGIKTCGLFPMGVITVLDSLFTITYFLVFLHIFYKEKFIVKAFHFVVIMFQGILSDILYHICFQAQTPGNEGYVYGEVYGAQSAITVTLIFIVINMIYIILFTKIKKKSNIDIKSIIVTIFFAFILLAITFNHFKNNDMDIYMSYVAVFTTVLFAFFITYLSASERQKAKDELKSIELIMEGERLHYEQIEKRSEEMSKIRHDYNNVLGSVLYLLKEGQIDEASNIIEELIDKVNLIKGNDYCNVPIINAIINEKKKICEESNITLNVDIVMPDDIKVKALDLCMIFANVLDNAIRSCMELLLEGMDSSIDIVGRQVKGYIIFKCINKAIDNPKGIIKGTGYGKKILADIANRYSGEFHTEYKDGIYEVRISLRNIENIRNNGY